VLICYRQEQNYDAAACRCGKGQMWRTKDQLKAWAARQDPKPVRIGRIEDFYTEQALSELVTEDGPPMSEVFGK